MPIKPRTFFMNEQHELPREFRLALKSELIDDIKARVAENVALAAEIADLKKTRDVATFSEVKKIQALTKLCHRSEVVLKHMSDLLGETKNITGDARTEALRMLIVFLVQDLKEVA